MNGSFQNLFAALFVSQFQKVDLNEIKNEQRESDEEEEVQEDFGIVSKKKNVQYDEEDDDDIILDRESPKNDQKKEGD